MLIFPKKQCALYIPPWLIHFSLNLSHVLNVKHWQYSHWNVLVMDLCIFRINLEKLAERQNSECCRVDFWPVRGIGLSWNFKVLQWINLNESFRHYYIHNEDYLKRFKKKLDGVVSEIYKKALKVQILNEVAVIQVVRKRVGFQDRKNGSTPKFPGIKIWY